VNLSQVPAAGAGYAALSPRHTLSSYRSLRCLGYLSYLDLGSVRRDPSRMKMPAREYSAECTTCKTVYVAEDRYECCPVCGKPLVVRASLLKPLGRGDRNKGTAKRTRPRVGDRVILLERWAVEIRAVTRHTVDISPATVKPISVRKFAPGPEPRTWVLTES
jgi:predicted RNA-binding Zn-ribbon protein involved in translation (DUF1610 family)